MSETDDLARARLTIDLAALADNWRAMARLGAGAETSAVVKADAYGAGLEPAARALAKAGCTTFFVATLAEGEALRAILADASIFVLNGLSPGTAARFAAAALAPVLGSPRELEEWAGFRRGGGSGSAAVQVDTGMNRQGLGAAETAAFAADAGLVEAVAPTLVMSHLACADEPDHAMNRRQLERFETLSAPFAGIRRSLANSAGTMLGPAFRFDLTRPGIALYGSSAVTGGEPLATVVTAEVPIMRVREATAGETVGYGATETLARASRLAVLGAGYADGYHRAAGSSDRQKGADVFIRGRRAPLVGRVSMDLMVADVTDIDGVEAGDFAELFGPNIPIDEVAERAGTIGYELLTDLGRRYRRSYDAR